MAALFTNNSCNPFLDPDTPCTDGNEAWFTVNATGAHDFQATLNFTTTHNIRLVIRNTGHDYNGKSTGAGSVGLWTSHLKTQEYLEYSSDFYSGPAFKFGAGILTKEAYEFADSHGLLVVAANLPTVGLVGGYSQGGGHGPLASQYGLGADQVLEWEVMLASGQIVTASPSTEYSDLHWALCGGGGGTYGAVLSATVKGHPSLGLSTANLTFLIGGDSSDDTETFYEGIAAFQEYVPTINDAGAIAIWFATAQAFEVETLFAPGLNQTALDALMKPVLDKLDTLGIAYAYASEEHPSFLEGFLAQPSVTVSSLNIGGRLIPRTLIDGNNTALMSAVRYILEAGAVFSGVSFNVSRSSGDSVAANPYWRDAAFDAVIGTSFDWTDWDANIESANSITNDLLPQLEALTPNGAAYLNEADFQQPDWQSTFYGSHLIKLSKIKCKYDPKGIFYALGAVGSEKWGQKNDGRLCRAY